MKSFIQVFIKNVRIFDLKKGFFNLLVSEALIQIRKRIWIPKNLDSDLSLDPKDSRWDRLVDKARSNWRGSQAGSAGLADASRPRKASLQTSFGIGPTDYSKS